MKRSYKTIKENNAKSSTGRGRVSWEYYGAMEEIFAEDKTNHGSTLESTITNPESLNISCQSSVECIANENHENNMMRTQTMLQVHRLHHYLTSVICRT